MNGTDAADGHVSAAVTDAGDALVVTLAGELDLSNAGTLRALLEEQVSTHSSALVLDLASVTFMDSTALGVLVRIRKLLHHDDRMFRVVCPPGPVLRLFAITGLVSTFAVHDELSAALASLE